MEIGNRRKNNWMKGGNEVNIGHVLEVSMEQTGGD